MARAVKKLRVMVLMHEDFVAPESLDELTDIEKHRIKTEYDVVHVPIVRFDNSDDLASFVFDPEDDWTEAQTTGLHEPLAETLKRFNEMGAEAGSIDLPDFSEELKKARQEGDEKGAILLDVKKALDEELAAKNGLEAERERLREEISTMRKSHEEFVRAAEEEIDSLATSAAAAEEQKGFLHGLFGGKRGSDTAERAKSSRMKLKAAAALPGEPRIIEDAVEVEDAMPLEEVGGVEDATLAEEAEPIDFAAFDVPAPENLADDDVEIAEAEDAEDAVEVDEVEEGEEAGPAKKPRRARKPTKPAKGGKAERAPKKRRKR